MLIFQHVIEKLIVCMLPYLAVKRHIAVVKVLAIDAEAIAGHGHDELREFLLRLCGKTLGSAYHCDYREMSTDSRGCGDSRQGTGRHRAVIVLEADSGRLQVVEHGTGDGRIAGGCAEAVGELIRDDKEDVRRDCSRSTTGVRGLG